MSTENDINMDPNRSTLTSYTEGDVGVRNNDVYALLELGTTGLNRWGYDVYEEFLPTLRWPYAAKIYKEMSDNDATLGAVFYMMKQLIRKIEWKVVPGGNSMADMQAAEFVKECMDDMSTSWSDTISEVLSYFIYGWSFHEIVYKIRRGDSTNPSYKSKFNDGRVGWRKIPVRSQHTLYGWEFDPVDGDVVAMKQFAPPNYKLIDIPLTKGLLFRTEITRDNPEGRSLLRNAYRPWYFKKRIEEIEGIGIERDLAGLPTLTPPDGVDIWDTQNPAAVRLRTQAELIVKNVRRDKAEGVVIPFGWEFKLLSTAGTRQFDTNEIINRYDQRLAITMLADIVMLGADKVGSFALADVKKSLLSASLDTQTGNIAQIFNKYALPTLFKYNYFPGITKLPQILPSPVEMPSLKELGDFFRATGMKIDDDLELINFLRKIASIPEISAEKFKEIQAKRDQMRAQTGPGAQQRSNNAESAKENGATGNPAADKEVN